jgi:hypothetical protein
VSRRRNTWSLAGRRYNVSRRRNTWSLAGRRYNG